MKQKKEINFRIDYRSVLESYFQLMLLHASDTLVKAEITISTVQGS